MHLAGTRGSLRLGVVAVNLQVTQFGVRDQHAVVDEGGADAGAQGDDSNQAVTVTALTVGCLSQTGCVSVVEAVDGAAAQRLAHDLLQVGVNPGVVHVRCGEDHAVLHHGGEVDADSGLGIRCQVAALQLIDYAAYDLSHSLGGCGLGGVNAETVRNEVTGAQVNDAALNAGASNVHTNLQVLGGGFGQVVDEAGLSVVSHGFLSFLRLSGGTYLRYRVIMNRWSGRLAVKLRCLRQQLRAG